jgi:hypothetical protein
MDLFYVPSGPRDHSVRTAVNKHITSHLWALKRKHGVQMPWRKSRLARIVPRPDASFEQGQRPKQHSHSARLPMETHRLPSLTLARLEPFQLLHDNFTDPLVRQLFHHSSTVFWPGFDPGLQSFSIARFWIPAALQEPALFHAFMWAATLHRNIRGRTLIRHPGLLKHHYAAVQHLTGEFAKGITEVRDTLLLSILALQTHEIKETDVFKATDEGFQPSFADLQWLDVYSRRPYIETHGNALERFTDLRGGPECLELPGLDALMQYTDIIAASVKLRPPHFRPLSYLDAMGKNEPRWWYFGHDIYMEDDVTPPLRYLVALGLEDPLLDVILDMRIFTILIDAYCEKTVETPNLSRLALHRNLIHRRLLSTLPSEPESDELLGSNLNITALTRTVVMVFALGVTFPIAYKKPLATLVDRLQQHIVLHHSELLKLGLSDFLTWALIIGGIASAECTAASTVQLWYVQQLVGVEVLRQKLSWQSQQPEPFRPWAEIQRVCCQFLWQGRACDHGGLLLWQRVLEAAADDQRRIRKPWDFHRGHTV